MKIYNKENSKKEKIFFNEIFEDNTRFCKKINQIEYLNEGEIPIIDQGKSEIAGYSNLKENIYNDIPAIIFGDHTRSIKYIDFPFLIAADGVKVLKNKREDFLDKYLYYALKYFKIPNTGYNRHFKWLKEFSIYSLKIEEQNKIVRVLDNIQEIIKIKKEQLLQLNELSKSIFIKLKLKNKNWDIKSFAEVTKVSQGLQIPISKRKKENGKNRFKYITIQFLNGSKEVEYIENPRENVICSEEDILMTRTGNTGMVVTGVSGVFHNNFFIVRYDKNILLKEYLVAYLNSKEVQEEIKKRAGTSTIPDLNHGEFYKIKILIPPINFQEKFSKQIQVIAKSKVEIQKSIEETQKLFDSLMEKYFG